MTLSQSIRIPTWGLRILDCLLLTAIVCLFICPSSAHILPKSITELQSRRHRSTVKSSPRQPANFPRDFATAVGVAVAAVIIGTTAICVFAHCWRQILDWGWGHDRGVDAVKKRVRKDEEAWFCGVDRDRGLPMPQLSILPESEPLARSMHAPQSEIYTTPRHGREEDAAPTAYARNVVPSSWARPKAQWNNSGSSLPSWQDSGEIERPTSAVYLLDRP
ncbi:hypothetical protein GGR51DRAFT_568933 [Nemania sp. FL0031]|nr:hypothetical protein GGR51DRAFT_568933 [Nemania sp. FL0031]